MSRAPWEARRRLAGRPQGGPVLAAAILLLAVPLPGLARAQAADPPRIGVLMFAPLTASVQEGFRQGLREHGYVEGRSVVVEWRSAEGQTDRAGALAAEVVRLRVAGIVAEFTPAVLAAKRATDTIPIVMAPAGDPVATGLVASLARPGGNVTGLSNVAAELSGKRLGLLRELVPALTRVGLLIHGSDPLDRAFVEETRASAAIAGLQLHVAAVPRPGDLDGALATLTKARIGAVVVQGNVPVSPRRIAELALRHRLPSISPLPRFAEAGGLMAYGPSLADVQRRAAGHVDRILRGARPADLPVEQPTRLALVLNRKTARALGIGIPPALLLRADQVLE